MDIFKYILSFFLIIIFFNILQGKNIQKLRDAALSGDSEACLELGNFFFYASPAERDYYSAFDWYYKAALLKNPAAQFNVAICYDRGIGVKKNRLEALRWYRQAADNGVIQAKFNIALYYKNGATFNSDGGNITLEKDTYKSVLLLRDAANAGFPPALRELGKLYLKGEVVRKNLTKGISLIKLSAGGNDPEGMFLLADYYLYKKNKNYQKILSLLKNSAESGNFNAVEALAELYESGKGVKKDLKKALEFYKKAAENELVVSMLKLGDYNYYGIGKKTDIWTAKYWYKKAAEKNDPYALFMLGTFAEQGIGGSVNKKAAATYFLKSASRGFAKAQYNLAIYYKTGSVLKKSPYLARYWFRKAALQQSAEAQRELGFHYMYGKTGEKSYSAALNWLNLSKYNGDYLASKYLKKLELTQ
ncbi:MAG: SEL1-like repeat protein [Victivallales bacterium]|nr:SEL1-like repeat protein [Victivallales bacterium]MCF7888553.1 SEL1-like repeat protein [Victivallales bacterium]